MKKSEPCFPLKAVDIYGITMELKNANWKQLTRTLARRSSTLTLLVGMPASGKTTFVSSLCPGQHVINLDEIRKEHFNVRFDQDLEDQVFEIALNQARSILESSEKSVVIDETNLIPERRRQFIELAQELDIEVRAILFDPPIQECFMRNQKRRKDKKVPHHAMSRMRDAFMRLIKQPDEILKGEGIDKVHVLKF